MFAESKCHVRCCPSTSSGGICSRPILSVHTVKLSRVRSVQMVAVSEVAKLGPCSRQVEHGRGDSAGHLIQDTSTPPYDAALLHYYTAGVEID